MTEAALDASAPIAALPMYDLPELHAANDQLWRAASQRLLDREVRHTPEQLDRREDLQAVWKAPRLLLAQTCGYPLMTQLRGRVRLVVTPAYKARGCDGPFHRSVILVRKQHRAHGLADLKGQRLALNTPDSNTGMNLLRAELAPIARSPGFFSAVVHTGSHAASVAAVTEGRADVAAVDCVSWALLQRLRPAEAAPLRELGWTVRSPGLPLITSRMTALATFEALRATLRDLMAAPEIASARSELLLRDVHDLSEPYYLSLLHFEQMADGLGYPQLT